LITLDYTTLEAEGKIIRKRKGNSITKAKIQYRYNIAQKCISDMQELLRSPKTGRDILALSRNSFTSLKLLEIEKEKEIQLLHQRDSFKRWKKKTST
jgi:hypothetical protein